MGAISQINTIPLYGGSNDNVSLVYLVPIYFQQCVICNVSCVMCHVYYTQYARIIRFLDVKWKSCDINISANSAFIC